MRLVPRTGELPVVEGVHLDAAVGDVDVRFPDLLLRPLPGLVLLVLDPPVLGLRLELVEDLLVPGRVLVLAELVVDGYKQLDFLGALGALGSGDLVPNLEMPGDVNVARPALARGAHRETVDDFRNWYFRHRRRL